MSDETVPSTVLEPIPASSDSAVESKESKRIIRQHVTPDPFHVEPTLLVTRLASPGRRAVALFIDFSCIAVFSSLGISFLIDVSGYFFSRYAKRCYHGFFKGFSVAAGYSMLILGLLFSASFLLFRSNPLFQGGDVGKMSFRDFARFTTDDPETVRDAARSIGSLSSETASMQDIEEMREELDDFFETFDLSEERKNWILMGLEEGLSGIGTGSAVSDSVFNEMRETDSNNVSEIQLTQAHLDALRSEDSKLDPELTRMELKQYIAGEEIQGLQERERQVLWRHIPDQKTNSQLRKSRGQSLY